MIDAALAAAARYEAKVRYDGSPKRVASGLLDANDATIDFQAWTTIARLFETGQFQSIDAGGVREDTVISWPECEAAASKAVASLTKLVDEATDETREGLQQRRAGVTRIASLVAARRALMEDLTRQLHDRADRDTARAA